MNVRTFLLAALIASLPSCSGLPPECVALWQRLPNGSGEGWSDAELRSFANDAWAYSASQARPRVQWHPLFYVIDACQLGGSVEVSGELLEGTLARFSAVARDDEYAWTIVLINLGQLWRSGSEARVEADQKLRLLQSIEDEATTPFVKAVVPLRKVDIFVALDRADLLRDEAERDEAMRQVELMGDRQADLDDYWRDGMARRMAHAKASLQATRLGAPAPALAGVTLDGDDFDLLATRGTVTLIRFWGFW